MDMKKKILYAAIALCMVIPQVSGYADDITVYLDGKRLTFDQPPVIRDDFTLVPFRKIFESLGMTVLWNDAERKGIAEKDGLIISFTPDDTTMYVNGEAVKLLTPPVIVSDRILIPLRAVSEAAGADVKWDEGTRTVTVTSEDEVIKNLTKELLALTNAERAKQGLNPLVLNDKLSKAADAHCMDMIERGFFNHENPDGQSSFDRLAAAGIEYWFAGENIAAGQKSAASAVRDWMNSETHRQNIINPAFKSIGISVRKGGKHGIYWVQEFALLK